MSFTRHPRTVRRLAGALLFLSFFTIFYLWRTGERRNAPKPGPEVHILEDGVKYHTVRYNPTPLGGKEWADWC